MSFDDKEIDKSSRPKVAAEELEHLKFLLTEINRVAVRVGNEKEAPLHIYRTKSDINYTDLLQLANNTNFLEGEAFNLIEYGIGPSGRYILTYSLDDINQFQIVLDITDIDSFSALKRPPEFFFLTEDGNKFITEDGNNFKIQGLVP